MDYTDQIQLVDAVCRAVAKRIVDDIQDGKVPSTWDGVELHWLISERAMSNIDRNNKKRIDEFENTCLIKGL